MGLKRRAAGGGGAVCARNQDAFKGKLVSRKRLSREPEDQRSSFISSSVQVGAAQLAATQRGKMATTLIYCVGRKCIPSVKAL